MKWKEFGQIRVRTLSGARLARALQQRVQVDAHAVWKNFPEPAGRQTRDALQQEHEGHPSARTSVLRFGSCRPRGSRNEHRDCAKSALSSQSFKSFEAHLWPVSNPSQTFTRMPRRIEVSMRRGACVCVWVSVCVCACVREREERSALVVADHVLVAQGSLLGQALADGQEVRVADPAVVLRVLLPRLVEFGRHPALQERERATLCLLLTSWSAGFYVK